MTEASDVTRRLTRFYEEISSLDSIVRALSRAGVDTGKITAGDLYTRGLDCQNLGGFENLELLASVAAEYAPIEPHHRIVDVACGLGGPGRYLADRFGCSVAGIDLLPMRIDTARILTQMTGLADRVTYQVADATDLPFADRWSDQVWMLDASIHMRDKAGLFREIARVLQPGGLLVMHDQTAPIPRVMAPVTRRAPYIAPPLPQLIRYVEDAGLRLLTWRDTTDRVLEHFEQRRAAREERPEPTSTAESRRRRERQRVAGNAYIEALRDHGGRTGILVAKRRS